MRTCVVGIIDTNHRHDFDFDGGGRRGEHREVDTLIEFTVQICPDQHTNCPLKERDEKNDGGVGGGGGLSHSMRTL